MDFREIWQHFGGGVFGNGLRSNLASTQQQIQHLEQTVKSWANADARAACHLLKANFHFVRGAYVEGFEELDHIRELEGSLGPRWQARRKGYKFHAICLQRNPPLTRFRPNSFFGNSASIADAEHDMIQAQTDISNTIAGLKLQHDNPSLAMDLIELACLDAAGAKYCGYLAAQAGLDPRYPDILNKPFALTVASAAPNPISSAILDEVVRLQLHATARQLRLLDTDAAMTRASDDVHHKFANLVAENTMARDSFGLAWAYVARGDHFCSAPTTSLLALNLVLEGTLTGFEIDQWDATDFESRHQLIDSHEAEKCYEKAFDIFRRGNCARGLGAIHLRRACLLHMQTMADGVSKIQPEATPRQKEAFTELRAAESYFDLDISYSLITKAHLLLLSITSGEGKGGTLNLAREIGRACKEAGDRELSRFVGTLILRFGRRQGYHHGSTSNFLLCCRCAEACSQAAEDKIYEYQACIALTKLYCDEGSVPSARACLERAEGQLGTAQRTITALQNAHPNYKDVLPGVEANLKIHFDRVKSAVHKKAWDLSGSEPIAPAMPPLLPASYSERTAKSAATIDRLSREFDQAAAQALVATQSADYASYAQRLEEFVDHLTHNYDTQEIVVNGFHVRTLCLLNRYEAARLVLPSSVHQKFGGSGKDTLFESLLSTEVYGFKLSVADQQMTKVGKRSIANCVWAKDWFMAAQTLSAVRRCFPQYLEKLSGDSGAVDWQAQVEVAAIYEHNDGLQEALQWYIRAATTHEKHRSQATNVEARLYNMSIINSTELFAGLVRVSLRMHRANLLSLRTSRPQDYGLPGEDWLLQALLFAEQARARVLLDMLTPNIGNDHAKDFEEWKQSSHIVRQYEDLKYNLRPKQSTGNTDGTNQNFELFELEKKVQEARGNIERLWSATYLLLAASDLEHNALAMCKSVPADTLVLHYNTSDEGTVILAISREGILRVKEMELDRKTLRQKVLFFQRMMMESKSHIGTADRTLATETGDLLARSLLLPFQDLINGRNHIIFVPSHELNAYPLCSLPFEGRPLCLQKSCSVIPSLAILQRLARTVTGKQCINASVLVNQDESLYMTNVGATVVAEILQSSVTTTNSMSPDRIRERFENANLVFFASHGKRPEHQRSAWQAEVLLRPDDAEPSEYTSIDQVQPLRVIDLAKMRTQADVVVFCACVAAVGEVTNGNDLIGFSHAVLESGAQAFVGALWYTSDWATLLLMTFLHQNLVAHARDTCLAECLQKAQARFYHLTVTEAVGLLEEAKTSWERAAPPEARSETLFNDCRYCIDQLAEQIQDLDHPVDFKDPYYWAPWVIVGNGDVRLIDNRASSTQSHNEHLTTTGMTTSPTAIAERGGSQHDTSKRLTQESPYTPDSIESSFGAHSQGTAQHSWADLQHTRRASAFDPPSVTLTTAIQESPRQAVVGSLPPPPASAPPQLPPRPERVNGPTYDPAAYPPPPPLPSRPSNNPPIIKRRPVSQLLDAPGSRTASFGPPANSTPNPQQQRPVSQLLDAPESRTASFGPPVSNTPNPQQQRQVPLAKKDQMYFPPPPSSPAPPPYTESSRRQPHQQHQQHQQQQQQRQQQRPRQALQPQKTYPGHIPQAQIQSQSQQARERQYQNMPPRMPSGQGPGTQRQQQSGPPHNRRASAPQPNLAGLPSRGPRNIQPQPFGQPTRQQLQQPPPEKKTMGARFNKFMKSPAGQITTRVGVGLLVGGLIDGEAGDMDFGGGEDVDVGDMGGGDFGGGDDFSGVGDDFGGGDAGYAGDQGYADDGAYGYGGGYDDTGMYAQDEYGNMDTGTGMADQGMTFEDNFAADGTGGTMADQGMAFEDNFVSDGTGGQGYDTGGTYEGGTYADGGTGDGGGGGGDLPGQVGPCFEDNIILSRAAG